jgi:hypothetical protein
MATDLLVEVLKDGNSALRFFGVQLVGYLDLPELSNADERILAHPLRERSEPTMPVCVFVIGVRKPEGIYRWLMEPIIDHGRALLRCDMESDWRPLDDAEVSRLIDRVSDWYDALQNELTPKKGDQQNNS